MYEQKYTFLDKQEPHRLLDNQEPDSLSTRQILFKSLSYAVIAFLPLIGFLLGRQSHGLASLTYYHGHELPSDIVFGDIPRKLVLTEFEDQRFVDGEPIAYYPNNTIIPSIWDSIYPGSWVAISNPAAVGLKGKGMDMTRVAADPSAWPPGSEGFVVTALHQLHCVMSLKQAVIFYEPGDRKPADRGIAKRPELEHLNHCLELLRHAVMCHADLSLEPIHSDDGTQLDPGSGGIHMCRDWSEVYQAVLGIRITYSEDGWLDTSEKL
ncbi:hypothetical protein CONLIGDRAFT_647249 [Coniochaeta ligniaria NRRL 30616]|uniref:Tat pathway signal sequence n=1 Tax=Coniochaeta ligniaria NRRL 30616 TaxID=1408157 RepID=A0A1J7JD17_9PEZI|nr:hypothetical protein CONLIGDRAFT_647249 [Coniochaeta ligniaria NRRL 30616]